MATEQHGGAELPLRRRRKGIRGRLRSRPPISARLVLDNHLRGDVAILSDDLVTDLFPGINLTGVHLPTESS
jgi:peroxin-6